MKSKNNLYKVFFIIIALILFGASSYKTVSLDTTTGEIIGSKYQSKTIVRNLKTDNLRVTEKDIPIYDGFTKNLILNNNKSELDIDSMEELNFSNLDSKSRLGASSAILKPSMYQGSEKRAEKSDISKIKTTVWKNKKTNDSNIYKRSNLIEYAYKDAKTDSVLALMSGTIDFNNNMEWGISKYETKVLQAVKSEKTVYYELNPVFHGDNIVATGIQIRAISTDGSLDFNVFIYNVQDGIN